MRSSSSSIRNLDKLYVSTRAAKHYLREIVRGVEGYIVTGSKQVEIGTKLSEDSRKYGVENTCTSGNTLSKAALSFGQARAQMEKERENLLKALGTQVAEPMKAKVIGAPLEDAQHLAQRYDRMRQEAEAQAIDVSRRQAKARERTRTPDIALKLEAAEAKLQDLKSNVATLGKEASAVYAQEQKLTLQQLVAMVELELTYHQKVLQILDQLKGEMILECQGIEAPSSPRVDSMPPPPPYEELNGAFSSPTYNGSADRRTYFLAKVVYPFEADTELQLNSSRIING